jgi:hypothetical protein
MVSSLPLIRGKLRRDAPEAREATKFIHIIDWPALAFMNETDQYDKNLSIEKQAAASKAHLGNVTC